MYDLDPTSLIVGYVVGALLVLSLVMMIKGAQPDPNERPDDEPY